MKKIYYIALCVLSAIAMSSCDKDTTKGKTWTTYYPVITLDGSQTLIVQKDSEYEEPGYSAVMNGEDVTSEVTVETDLDMNTSGVYTVNYVCVNADGFSTSVSRKVIVVSDLNSNAEGIFLTSPESYRVASSTAAYGSSFEIIVTSDGNGTYSCDDLLGGFYCQLRGYGSNYAMSGTFSLDDSGNMTLISSAVPGWGDSADGLTGTFNSETSTYDFCTEYAGMKFYVTMTKEE